MLLQTHSSFMFYILCVQNFKGTGLLKNPQWGTGDAEIKHLSVENPELKGSLF